MKQFLFASGLIVLGAILFVIREQLLAISGWLFAALVLLLLACFAYGLYWLYSQFHKLYHGNALRQLEIDERRQFIELQAETWHFEHRNQIVLPAVEAEEQTQPLLLPPPARPGKTIEAELEIPSAPLFRQMSYLINSAKLILCYAAAGPVYGTVEDLLSMAVTGKPGRGKTTALMYYVAILLNCGAEVTIWDPHGAMNELAALHGKQLSHMPKTARVYYFDRKEDIIASLPELERDLQSRDDLYRDGHKTKHPRLLLADELPLLADFDEEIKAAAKRDKEDHLTLVQTIKRYVLEARKWKCYFIGSGQSFDAEILPTRVTENLASKIVFFSSDRRARMAGLENEAIKKYLPALRRAGPGIMVFDCARFDEPILGAIPEISVADLMDFLGVEAFPRYEFAGSAFEEDENDPETRPEARVTHDTGALETFPGNAENRPESVNSGVSTETKKTILKLSQKGMAMREIAVTVGLSGRKYGMFKLACQEIGLE